MIWPCRAPASRTATCSPRLCAVSCQLDDYSVLRNHGLWANGTIQYLTDGRDKDKPFCFVVSFFDPHHGFGSPPEYRARYDAEKLPRPITSDLSTMPAVYTDASKASYVGKDRGFRECTP